MPKSEEKSPFGPTSQKAPMWLRSEAVTFLVEKHPTMLTYIKNRMDQDQATNLEDFMLKNHMGFGMRVRNLLREMKYTWDAIQLDDSYIEIVRNAMETQGLL